MFFILSGMGLSFYKTEKNNFFTFLCDKFFRLVIPFFIAVFVFVTPKLYLSQDFEKNGRLDK